jgi:glycosyltransferase involved in cell wall biosynthesis
LRRLTKRYELRYLALSSDVVVTTAEDGRWLESIYGRQPTAIIPTGVTVGPRRITGSSPRRRIGWLSALDVVDNIQGLDEFLRSGWPKLAAQGCELVVAGRNPGPEVFTLTNVPGVTLLGHVPSIDEFLATVEVGVIPLWSGRGIKVKTLTFMAAGIPVAATPMAVEGMIVDHGKECLIGDTPEELADHLLTLLEDQELADAIGEAGRQLIIRSFTWEALGREFVDVVDHAMARAR